MLIEFFPSFRDLSEQIDYFNSHYCNNRPENYDIEYRNNYCCVYFYNKETAFAFTKYINTLRAELDNIINTASISKEQKDYIY